LTLVLKLWFITPTKTIPTSRYTPCQLLVLQKCLYATFRLSLAFVWVPEHEKRVQTLHLPNCCIFQGAPLLNFPLFESPSMQSLLNSRTLSAALFTVLDRGMCNKKYMSVVSK